MKTNSIHPNLFPIHTSTKLPRLLATLSLTAFLGAAASASPPAGLVVHEWGTFTSVQGADGALMSWRPLQTAELPKFVYDWSHPGYNRSAAGQMLLNKGGLVTLQRMETPVIYFYSDEELTAKVSVKFPQGTITEWYPQARQIGPAVEKPPQLVAQLDGAAHKVGVTPTFTFASLLPHHTLPDSRIVWSDVRVLPAKQHEELAGLPPSDKSSSHYFAARETDAAILRVNAVTATNTLQEHEKFLFYRGAGNFATPLTVTLSADGKVTAANTGKEPLANLLLLNVKDGVGAFASLARLDAGGKTELALPPAPGAGNTRALQERSLEEVGAQVEKALVDAGLFAAEAKAMVNTWKDTWFADEGLRVLYLLPREWTDRTLPLEVDPKPQGLVRVMVGRAEILTPRLENTLHDELTKAQSGDATARASVIAEFKKLGRFALPAYERVTNKSSDTFKQFGWTLLQEAGQRAPKDATAGLSANFSPSVF